MLSQSWLMDMIIVINISIYLPNSLKLITGSRLMIISLLCFVIFHCNQPFVQIVSGCRLILSMCMLNLPSLFATRLFWTFHNKLHNMKALVILNHHDHHFSHLLTCFYKKNDFLWVPVSSSGVFAPEKTSYCSLFSLCFNIGAHIGICAQISRNTLLKKESLILLLMLISDWLTVFQEHSIVMRNFY